MRSGGRVYNRGMCPASRVVDYAAFPQPPHALFRDYVAGAAKTAPFFADGGRWDLAAVEAAAGRAAARDLPREALARAVVRQQQALGSDAAARSAARLAQRESVAIVTGQQPVLFGGPLFVLYKAMAALEIAARLERSSGRPVVPIFWVAADDHDFAEIRLVPVLDESGSLRHVRYAPRQEPAGQPASAIVLEDSIGALVDEVRGSLPAGEASERLTAAIAAAYRPGATLAGAFAHLVSSLLPELVVLDPSDPELKTLMAPVLAREIREESPTSRIAAETGTRLLEAGYHQQVPVRTGLLNAFVLEGGARRPLGLSAGRVEVRGGDESWTTEDAARLASAEPDRFSAGVLLRPLAQDHLLPTAAYIGGPSEVAYHAQIGAAYAHFGVPRPVLVPRPGVTLVDSARTRALETEGLDLPDLQGDAEGVIARWVRQAYPDVEAGFERVRAATGREMGELEAALGTHDPTLRGAAGTALGRMLHQLDGLQEKSMRALKKRDQARAERLRRTHDMLFPGGSFQERGIGLVSLMARFGEAFLPSLREAVDPFARGHQVVTLQ
jgi:bacillithiol biosynthesis cysteine-adding enzyme BshC